MILRLQLSNFHETLFLFTQDIKVVESPSTIRLERSKAFGLQLNLQQCQYLCLDSQLLTCLLRVGSQHCTWVIYHHTIDIHMTGIPQKHPSMFNFTKLLKGLINQSWLSSSTCLSSKRSSSLALKETKEYLQKAWWLRPKGRKVNQCSHGILIFPSVLKNPCIPFQPNKPC